MSQNATPNPGYSIKDLAELMAIIMRMVASNINCCLIGNIAAINTNGTVQVAVSFQKIIKGVVALPNGVMGDQIINYPALVNVPVFVYQGGGAYISMPIVATTYNSNGTVKQLGDRCLLLFCDRDMDSWFENGTITTPNSDRLHSINDAIAIVGINNLTQPLLNQLKGMIYMNCWWTQTSGNFVAGNGFDGTFPTGDARVVTVSGGIIISVE